MEIVNMKMRFIQLVTLVFVAMLSVASYAGGAGCDSKKGHGNKDMSAAAEQEFKDSHSWLFSEKSSNETMDKSAQPAKSSSENDNMVEI
jgi:hypothetical protein